MQTIGVYQPKLCVYETKITLCCASFPFLSFENRIRPEQTVFFWFSIWIFAGPLNSVADGGLCPDIIPMGSSSFKRVAGYVHVSRSQSPARRNRPPGARAGRRRTSWCGMCRIRLLYCIHFTILKTLFHVSHRVALKTRRGRAATLLCN